MEMTRQEKIIWSLLAGILVVLFLLSSTDLIIKEKETEVYPVSVIIADTTDDYYTNFRKGVDQAADEYHVDVNFITLYEKGDAAEQMELFGRELDDGAKAVVLAPVKPEECGELLGNTVLAVPVVNLGDKALGGQAMSTLSPDYREAGRLLGEAIARENAPGIPVLAYTQGLDYGYNKSVWDGLNEVLSKAGFQVSICEKERDSRLDSNGERDGGAFRRRLEEAAYSDDGKIIIAALDVESLGEAADILAGGLSYGSRAPVLYGYGSTTKLLNQMDRGLIKGLVTTNQFDMGYLSIVRAVESIGKKHSREQTVLESYYIEKDNLREPRFEKILYPIE